jgi:hypothetical protein
MAENSRKVPDGMSMCMGKVVVRCPKCGDQIQLTRPDSHHPFWSTDKPGKDEGIVDVVEQVVECRRQTCASKFHIYWYDK